MSNISLRSYNREIESMIDQGRIDEAIAHARHILKSFPKVIETYRLLGKAYLENSQNNDAADIFQRVLSAEPDDFVAHIGMSLIREEEGNLSSAVQHMERAFEKQPYNNAIQEELKRLYGKRDGIEPPKVRLTQGALSRMYLKGDLQQQGIAELRAALAENPDRYDLKTLLAEACVEADQMAEAIDLSSDLLKKFPYNLTANRILANTLKTHDQPQEMAVCRQRLYALAPYEAYISEHAPTVDQVPDRAITIDRLDWSEDLQSFPTRTREETTPWTSSTADSPQEKENLDWLDPAGDDIEEMQPIPEETLDSRDEDEETSSPAEENIPEWMEEAGWTETDHIDEELQKGYQDLGQDPEEPGQVTGDLAPADIPDWLLEKAPSSEPEDAPSEVSSPESTKASIPGSAQDDLSEMSDEPLDQESLEDSDIQEEEKLFDKEPAEKPLRTKPQEEEIQPTDDDLPGWLKDLKSEEDDQETAIAWLKDMPQDNLSPAEDSTAPSDTAPSDTSEDESAQPDWLDEMMAEDDIEDDRLAADQAPVSGEDDFQSEDEFPEKDSPPEPSTEGKTEISTSEFPDWFDELQAEATDEEKPEQGTTSKNDESDLSEQDLDWSPGFDIEDIDQDPAAAEEDADQDKLQDEDILQERSFSDLESSAPEDHDQEDQIPDWLSDLDSEEGFEDEPDIPEITAPGATPDSEETQREEDDFLFDESGPPAAEDDEAELDQLSSKQSEFTAQEIEKESLETTADSVTSSESARSEGSLPDWLSDLNLEGEGIDEEPSDDDEFTPPPSPEPEKPELQDAQTAEVEKDKISAEEKEIPNWLGDQAQTKEPEAVPDLDDEEDSMAWLESLAAKQGAKEEDFVTSTEERAEAQPPQVKEDITETTEEPQPSKPEEPPIDPEAVKGELPDWLAELQSEQIPEDVDEEEAPASADEKSFSPDEPELETEEDIFTEQSTEKGGKPETREKSAQETSLPEWLANLDADESDLGTEEKSPFGEEELSPTKDTIPDEPTYLDLEMEDSMEEPETDTAEQREPDRAEGDTLPESIVDSSDSVEDYDFLSEDALDEESIEEEGSLPDWLAELEEADSEDDSRLEEFVPETAPRSDANQPLPGSPETEMEPTAEEEIFEESDQTLPGEDVKVEAEPIEESTISPIDQEEVMESEPDSSDFGGMLDHLRSDDVAEEVDEIPDWIQNLKEEEDPQETAILWLQNFIEKGDQADLKSEIKHFTDSLRPDQDLPNWMEDLQKEEDPQTTAMLWLEKLEKEQIRSESDNDDHEVSDWLADLDHEQKMQEDSKSAVDNETDDRDWLGELEKDEEKQEEKVSKQWAEATEPKSPEDQETEGDTPDWMKATSPLEGDFLTSELESELDQEEIQEEIPDWLAGYEDEDEILPEDEEAIEDLGVQADQESEKKNLTPEDDYTWLAEGEEQEPVTIEPSPAKIRFNLNQVGISDLESIFGISFQAAKSIVSYREKHGSFQSFTDLNDIPEVEPDQIKVLRENTLIPTQESKEETERPETKDEPAPAFDDKHQRILHQAQQALEAENIDQALEKYAALIDKKKNVDQVIDDLTSASLEYPMSIQIIKTLGDAYMKIDQLQEALDAYSKAEDLLH